MAAFIKIIFILQIYQLHVLLNGHKKHMLNLRRSVTLSFGV